MTAINQADKVYLGSTAVDAVYANGVKVWPAGPTVAAVVQRKTGLINAGAAGVPLPLTFDNPTTPGNAIVVSVSGWNTGNNTITFSCSDNKGNTYASTPGGNSKTPGQAFLQQFFCANIAGGAGHIVTPDSDIAHYIQAEIMEVSGIVLSGALDASGESELQGFAGTSTSGSATATGKGFAVAAMSEDGGLTVTGVSAGWTESYDGNTGQPLHTAYRSVTAGAQACTFTMSGFAGSAGSILVLKVKP